MQQRSNDRPLFILLLMTLALLILSSGSLRAANQAQPGEIVENSIGMKLAFIPAGIFTMGSPADERMRQDEERQREVKISRPFRISATEVTQQQWQAIMELDRSANQGDTLPVENISWREAVEFCRKLSEKEGKRYRLPTEAEWEYACRAGTTGAFSPDADLEEIAWFDDNSDGQSHPVGLKRPNSWGLHDMHGNVAEWCSDTYGPYEGDGQVVDPEGPEQGRGRVVRGGSWRGFPPSLRCAARSSAPESYQLPYIGFRVVMEPD
jgi:formylglycine-generating enzyme required for sulfatase activity